MSFDEHAPSDPDILEPENPDLLQPDHDDSLNPELQPEDLRPLPQVEDDDVGP